MKIMISKFARIINNLISIADASLVRRSSLLALHDRIARLESAIARADGVIDVGGEQQSVIALLSLLTPVAVVGGSKVRIGRAGDGGYVMLDRLHDGGTAFSFGIDKEVSWDFGMAERSYTVHQFDHSVDGPPSQHANFRFNKTMIAPFDGPGAASIESLVRDLAAPGRRNVLKMDIEGAEWDAFDATSAETLDRFSQIVCELHDFSRASQADWRGRSMRVLEKLSRHFVPIHVHGNNCVPYAIVSGVPCPDALEVTFVNRHDIQTVVDDTVYPTDLDHPNFEHVDDWALGSFRFRRTS